MRKLLALAFAVAIVAPSVAFAKGGNHPMAGCGLGYVLFGNSDSSRLMQILAATTNGTSGNQTFGITSGTSGCTQDGAVKFAKEAEVYAEVNIDSLRVEMAQGSGNFVHSFAFLLGANDAQVPAYIQLFKDNYATLFPTSSTTSGEMMSALSSVLSQKA